MPTQIIVALILALGLAACGGDGVEGGGGASPAAEQVDPPTESIAPPTEASEPSGAAEDGAETGDLGGMAACDLITTEEFGTALGTEVATAEGEGELGTYFCFYYGPDGEMLAGTSFVDQVVPQVYSSWAGDPSAQPVSGIGDEAVWVADSQLFLFRKGDAMVSIQPYALDEAEAREVATEAGRIAAGGL